MAIVEVIVGMVFTFLLLSLLGTTVNELIAAWRGWRGFYLEEGLKRLLEHWLVIQVSHAEGSRHLTYQLTEKDQALLPVLA